MLLFSSSTQLSKDAGSFSRHRYCSRERQQNHFPSQRRKDAIATLTTAIVTMLHLALICALVALLIVSPSPWTVQGDRHNRVDARATAGAEAHFGWDSHVHADAYLLEALDHLGLLIVSCDWTPPAAPEQAS